MDWAAAYDRMRPSITSAAFRQLGLPEPLAKLIPVAGSATPQGCPLAPFCLSFWVSSGVRCVETSVADSNAVLSCYMDDRSWFTSSWDGVRNRIHCWGDWSRKMGLKEAPEKIQVCARGKVFNQILVTQGQPDWIKSDIRILGAFSVSAPRQYSEVEKTRLAGAEQQAALLATTGLAWDRMILAHRAFVINKASFGWVGRFPTLGSSEKLFSSLSRAFRAGRLAARALRKVLYGGAVLLNKPLGLAGAKTLAPRGASLGEVTRPQGLQ